MTWKRGSDEVIHLKQEKKTYNISWRILREGSPGVIGYACSSPPRFLEVFLSGCARRPPGVPAGLG